MIDKFNEYIKENTTWITHVSSYPDLIYYINKLEENTERQIEELKNQQLSQKEEIKNYLIGKILKIKAKTNFDYSVTEYDNILAENIEYNDKTGSLMIFAKGPFDFLKVFYVKEILNIKENKRKFSPEDPYGEEQWEENN